MAKGDFQFVQGLQALRSRLVKEIKVLDKWIDYLENKSNSITIKKETASWDQKEYANFLNNKIDLHGTWDEVESAFIRAGNWPTILNKKLVKKTNLAEMHQRIREAATITDEVSK